MRAPLLVLVACSVEPEPDADPTCDPSGETPLEVTYLAVGGVSLTYGEDRVLTAPLYSNPSLFSVTLGTIETKPEVIDRFLPIEAVEGAAGVLVGHAHYDHLMDAPHVAERAGGAPIYGNQAVNWLVGDSVVLNDPDHPLVDMRMCTQPDPCTGVPAGNEGDWVHLPDSDVRIRALCSMHPPQFLETVHFGEGCVDEPWDEPPARAEQWKEGATLAYLIDFLDSDGTPVHRVYYQDAPTDGPTGHVHPDLLAEKAVDVAILNVGNYDAVREQPAEILANLTPRYVLGVHWEDFFRTLDEPLQPIPFHASVAAFDSRVDEALFPSDEPPVQVDGQTVHDRYWRPEPGAEFTFDPEPVCPPR